MSPVELTRPQVEVLRMLACGEKPPKSKHSALLALRRRGLCVQTYERDRLTAEGALEFIRVQEEARRLEIIP